MVQQASDTYVIYICTTDFCVDGGNLVESMTLGGTEDNDYTYMIPFSSGYTGAIQTLSGTTGSLEIKPCS